MPLAKLNFRPGVNAEFSPTQNEAGWSDANLVRWRSGIPEKFGGWVLYGPAALLGAARALHAWTDLSGSHNLGCGTTQRLYVVTQGVSYDITPARRTASLSGPFTTTAGSASVTVTDTAHGAAVGDVVVFSGAAAVGGITLAGAYTVASVTNANAYTVAAASAATASATGGGTVSAAYLIALGASSSSMGLGYGADVWGAGAWGRPRTTSGIVLNAMTWHLDTWGEWLIAVPSKGSVYAWQPGGGLNARAALVANATTPANGPPLVVGAGLVGMPERHLILFGCSDLNAVTNYDPLLVRWSDVEDLTTYNATATNSAGSMRIEGGSQIVGALNITGQTLIWTDDSLTSMRFVGLPYVYSFSKVGSNCGLIGPHAALDVNGVTYWMGPHGFFAYQGGAPQPLVCTVHERVFDNLNTAQVRKIYAGHNAEMHEVMWLYPSASAAEPDSYVIFNYVEQCWYPGSLDRTAWIDGEWLPSPFAVSSGGLIYQHETGVDDDTGAMTPFLVSGYFDVGDGTEIMFLDRLIPDFGTTMSGAVAIYLDVTDYPGAAPRSIGPLAVTPTTKFCTFRARARQARIRITSGSLGDWWRLGAVRINQATDGRRC